ncbi:unnamed protein product [Ceratitis capitata]|uniref:(Mediterranean fruit fly) hypothetical protein n=1 Tax=Ceratitis capitata TaxID=7213 RepID=A0A811VAU2_CERCA|nr:unnamed protein product [Ceratitis capitata]
MYSYGHMCNADGCEGNADADADADTTSVSSGNETTRFNLHLPEFFLLQIYREASNDFVLKNPLKL